MSTTASFDATYWLGSIGHKRLLVYAPLSDWGGSSVPSGYSTVYHTVTDGLGRSCVGFIF